MANEVLFPMFGRGNTDEDGGYGGDGIIYIETGKMTTATPSGYGSVVIKTGAHKWLGRVGNFA